MAGLGMQQAVLVGYTALVQGEQLQATHGRFACLTAAWLTHLAALPDAEAAFSRLPECAATNACALVKALSFVSPTYLRSAPWAPPVVSRFCCEMLGRRDLLTSPFTRYALLDAVYALAQYDEHQERVLGGGGRGMISAAQLFDLVDPSAAAAIQPPLLGLYVELGLHTNSEMVTDKNYQRMTLMTVLRRLWKQPGAWAAVKELSKRGGGETAFGEFATTLVKENVFLLDDALGRLADVQKFEAEKADEAAWQAQPARQRADRERRLEQFRRTAKSFLQLGKLTLSALLLLVSDAEVGLAFVGRDVPERAHKVANMLVEFLRRLCGPECQSLKVQGREKLGWEPRRMLADTTELLLACHRCVGGAFVEELVASDSYQYEMIEKAYSILLNKCQAEFPPTKLDKLGGLLVALKGGAAGAGAAGPAAGEQGSGAEQQSVTQRAVAAAAASVAGEATRRCSRAWTPRTRRPCAPTRTTATCRWRTPRGATATTTSRTSPTARRRGWGGSSSSG